MNCSRELKCFTSTKPCFDCYFSFTPSRTSELTAGEQASMNNLQDFKLLSTDLQLQYFKTTVSLCLCIKLPPRNKN